MEPSESFNLRWEDFGASTRDALKELREEVEFLDVTLLAGDGRRVQASKVVLAAGSPFFFKILRENPHPHPLIYLKGVNLKHLLSVSDFLYTGEANVAQEDVKQFLEIAEDLKIKGLTPIKIPSRPAPHQNKKSAPVPMDTHPPSEICQDLGLSPPPLSSSLTHQGGQVIAEEPGLSHGTSHAHSTISHPQDPVAIEEAASTPRIPHSPGAMYSPRQGQVAHREPAPEPRVSHSRSFASSRGINTVPQSTCEEDHGGKIKIEAVFAQKDPKEGTLETSNDIVISEATDSIFENKHYWYGQDEENSMALAGEHDENIELDTRNVGDKEETVDSNCDIVTEALESEFINEHSTNGCYQEDKENDVIMLDGKQNPHDEIGFSRRCKKNFVDIVSSRKYNCTQCSKKFSILRLFNLHLKVHAVKKTSHVHSTISPPQDPPEETALPPWIPHPRRVINRPLRGQATEHKSAPVPRVSYSRRLATPRGSNTVQQSACEEENGGLKHKSVKCVNKNKDAGLSSKLKQNEQAIFYVIDPKEEALDSSSDIVISEATDNAFENKQLIHDWYGQDKENSMTLAGEQDLNIELDISNVGDKEAMVVSNGVIKSECINEPSTNGCYEEDKDKENDVIMLNGKQNPNSKVDSSEKYRCMQCSKKFSVLNIFQMHLKVHAMKRKK